MKSLITTFLILILGFGAIAQEEIQETQTRPFQISFITPLGTNGIESGNINNNFSINLFGGYNGGLDGLEVSGFAGILKNNMKGTQIAGFGNIVLKEGNGAQLAGFFNYNKKYFSGVQIAGFSNIITSETKACQISGFTNIVSNKIDGAQIAGFTNISHGNTVGQLSGFANLNKGDLNGFQIAGFSNINKETTKGVQLSGFFNFAKKLNGVQIAPFNYVDSLEKGVSIGFFSVVKNGYRSLEISSNETMFGLVSYKTGTKNFYNIISVGGSYRNDKVLYGWGYGVGSLIDLKNNWDLAIELCSHQINENEWFTKALNQNNKLLISTSKNISQNIKLFGGFSWNVNVSETKDKDGNTFKSSVTPWDVFNKTYDDVNVKMYPGFTAGIRF